MSEFIKNVKATFTGNLKPVNFERLKTEVSEVPDFNSEYNSVKEYKIGVEYSFKVHCKKNHLDKMIDNCIRQLKEMIYGNIKLRILRLEQAIYEQNNEKASMEIRDILREIFE